MLNRTEMLHRQSRVDGNIDQPLITTIGKRVSIGVLSTLTFFLLLCVGVLLPLAHQKEFGTLLQQMVSKTQMLPDSVRLTFQDATIAFFPLRVVLHHVTCTATNPNVTGYVESPKIAATISLLSLFQGNLRMTYLHVERPTLTISGRTFSFRSAHGKLFVLKDQIAISETFLIHSAGMLSISHGIWNSHDQTWNIPEFRLQFVAEKFEKITELFPSLFGSFSVQGHLQGHTNSVTGSVHLMGQDVRIKNLAFETLDAQVSWDAHQLHVTNATVSTPTGNLSLTSATAQLSQPYSLSASIHAKHWDIAPLLHLVTPTREIHGQVEDGTAHVMGTLFPLQLNTTSNAEVSQIGGSFQPTIPSITWKSGTVTAQCLITENTLHLQNLTLESPETHVTLTGDMGTSHTQLNLHIPQISLNEFQNGWDIPMDGKGSLTAAIQQTNDKLSIEGHVHLKRTLIGAFAIPSISAPLRYRNHQLHIYPLTLTGLDTLIRSDIAIPISAPHDWSVQIDIPKASVPYLKAIFPHSPFPLSPLTQGSISGNIVLTGNALDRSFFSGYSTLAIQNVVYGGEKWDSVDIKGKWHRNTLHLQHFYAKKAGYILSASGQLHPSSSEGNISFQLEKMPLAAWDCFARHHVPVTGTMEAKGIWKTTPKDSEGRLDLVFDNATLHGITLPPTFSLLSKKEDHAHHISMGNNINQPSIRISVNPHTYRPMALQAHLVQFPIFGLLAPYVPNLLPLLPFGQITLDTDLTEKGDHSFPTPVGFVSLHNIEIGKNPNTLQLLTPQMIPFQSSTFKHGISWSLADSLGNTITLRLAMSSWNTIDAFLSGAFDLGMLRTLTPLLPTIRGIARGDIHARHHNSKWFFNSPTGIDISRTTLKLEGIAQELTCDPFRMSLTNNTFAFRNVHSPLSSGSIVLSGAVTFPPDTLIPHVDIQGQLRQAALRIPECITGTLDGNMTLTGKRAPYTLEGDMIVPTAGICQAQSIPPKPSQLEAALLTTPAPSSLLQIRAHLHILPKSLAIHYGSVHAALGGDVSVTGTPQDLQLAGQLSGSEGTVTFRNNPFVISQLMITLDPRNFWKSPLFLKGLSHIREHEVHVTAQGPLLGYDFHFTTVPPLSTQDTLGLILFGSLAADLGQTDKAQLLQLELGNALLHHIPLAHSMLESTGIAVHITHQPSPDGKNVIPQVTLRRSITERVSAEFRKQLDAEAKQSLILEYDISPTVKVRGTWGTPNTARPSDAPTDKHLGIDLRLKTGLP